MVRTPIPEAFADSITEEFSGSWFDTLWKALILLFLAGLVYFLASLSLVGAGVIAFIIISAVASDWVRDVISDLWNRNLLEV